MEVTVGKLILTIILLGFVIYFFYLTLVIGGMERVLNYSCGYPTHKGLLILISYGIGIIIILMCIITPIVMHLCGDLGNNDWMKFFNKSLFTI